MKRTLYTLILIFLVLPLFGQHTQQSVLGDGEIYKVTITETGVHRITADFLSSLGVNLSEVDPRNISIYGNGGGMLPELVGATRADDLIENAIQIVGEEDGRFDSGDYILFYAENADKQYYDEENELFRISKNVYDTKNYYFLKIQTAPGKRIEEQASISSTDYSTTSFDAIVHLEDEKVNLLDASIDAQGSGRNWYGDQFKNISSYTYNFNFPNIISGEVVKIYASLVARNQSNSRFSIVVDEETFESSLIQNTSGSFREPSSRTYAAAGTLEGNFKATTDNIALEVIYTGTEAWLDFITLNARRTLRLDNEQLCFRDQTAKNHLHTTYELQNMTANAQIWDITNPLQPKLQRVDGSSFGASNEATEFVAFTTDQTLAPIAGQRIANQNIHALENSELIILFHERFTEAAVRLMEHRRTYSNLIADTVRIDLLYNEFSSGRQDPTAIRDFAYMLHQRNPNFKYLLLFGDGSFDYRNLNEIPDEQNSNFIPVFETEYSLSPLESYPSDDYYCLLNEEEGGDLRGNLEIAIGRIPVKTIREANQVVYKIIAYDTAPESLGDWRNRLAFIADDQDTNLHFRQTDGIAKLLEEERNNYNQDKIYFDAFPQVSTSGGEGFPLATEALHQTMFKGAIAVNYLGHGGSKGWAQERVLDRDRGDIRSWTNFHRLPVFITATCSFTGYDDPNQVTAGEEVLLNPVGGGIALFTTVRAVFATSNEQLVRAVFDTMLYRVEGERPTLGEIMRIAKNKPGIAGTSNSRKFALIGDPALQLALPKYNVVTTSINGRDVRQAGSDTLQALQSVTIEGEIHDANGQIVRDFNGEITPSIFDKKVVYFTLGQDNDSSIDSFQLQNNVLFKGRASVQQGRFSFTFVMPKDINFSFGEGRISYYAKDSMQMIDAAGNYKRIVIGGADEAILSDDVGPVVEVFMNTEDFIFGSITSENPTLLVKLSDDNGINVAGNSIGHDLEAILDDNTQNTYLLNEFYESDLDDYTKGVVRFPLSDLEPGLHTIRVKAWDIANNSAEGYTEFVVAESSEAVIRHLLNYPNPFAESTCFQFEHNLGGQEVDINIQIYSIDGRLVKTLEKRIFAEGFITSADDCIQWNGDNDFGQSLPNGIYVYRVQLKSNTNVTKTVESEFQKLVLLK